MENPEEVVLEQASSEDCTGEWVAAGDGDGGGEGEGKHVSSAKWRIVQDSQLSNCMMHVCTSMGKFFRSMGQARVSVILRREDSTGECQTLCSTGEWVNPFGHPMLQTGWYLARDALVGWGE